MKRERSREASAQQQSLYTTEMYLWIYFLDTEVSSPFTYRAVTAQITWTAKGNGSKAYVCSFYCIDDA